jgi:hypothetical protein
MEMSGQLHTQAALPSGKKAPGTDCIGGWVDRLSERYEEQFLPLLGFESRVSSFPGSLFKGLIKFLLTLCGVRKSVLCADNVAGTSTEKCTLSTQTRQNL